MCIGTLKSPTFMKIKALAAILLQTENHYSVDLLLKHVSIEKQETYLKFVLNTLQQCLKHWETKIRLTKAA